MRKHVIYCMVISIVIVLCSQYAFAEYIYSSLDYPGTLNSTHAHDISGNKIVGTYYVSSETRDYGFLYDGTNWTTLNYPGSTFTWAYGIDGSNIVGVYNGGGFLYDGVNWTSLNYPGAVGTLANGIDNGNIVGHYNKDGKTYGFIYDGTNWTSIEYPGAIQTTAQAISGNRVIVWWWGNDNVWRSALYNKDNGSFSDMPEYPGGHSLWATGIDGDNIVGVYDDNNNNQIYGFLYDGINWTRLNYPGAIQMMVEGIDNDTIVGGYVIRETGGNHSHGFVAALVPEPPNQPPVALCKDVTVSAGSACTASASIDNGSYDPEGDTITFSQSPPGPYSLGNTLVTLIVTDTNGASNQCNGTVTVVDSTPPPITFVSVSPSVLWPANRKMVDVTVNYDATDNCDQTVCQISSVSSNEQIHNSDYLIVDAHHVKLRADRLKKGDGRIYTITIVCTDDSGNSSSQILNVDVPTKKVKM